MRSPTDCDGLLSANALVINCRINRTEWRLLSRCVLQHLMFDLQSVCDSKLLDVARTRPSAVVLMENGRKIKNNRIGAVLDRYALYFFRIVNASTSILPVSKMILGESDLILFLRIPPTASRGIP